MTLDDNDTLLRNGPDDLRQLANTAFSSAGNVSDSSLASAEVGSPRPPRLRVVNIRELLALQIPERQYLLEPLLREKETAMLHAWRGVGKTHVGLQIAFAVASGGAFLKWRAPQPRRVLYLDGEMPARTMQERLAAIEKAGPKPPNYDPAFLRLVCADLQEEGLLSLSTQGGQSILEPFLKDADLIIVDSISTLTAGGKENEAESWLPMQAWALALRRRGKSVLLLHHDGKSGQQRGTSRREDILDVVLHLRRPADYQPSQGARFEVHFEKARGLVNEAVEPFEAWLKLDDEQATWTTGSIEDFRLAKTAALFRDGCTIKEVMQQTNVSRSTAFRHRNIIKQNAVKAQSQRRKRPGPRR